MWGRVSDPAVPGTTRLVSSLFLKIWGLIEALINAQCAARVALGMDGSETRPCTASVIGKTNYCCGIGVLFWGCIGCVVWGSTDWGCDGSSSTGFPSRRLSSMGPV